MGLICIVKKEWIQLLIARIYTGGGYGTEPWLKGTEPQALFPLLTLVICWWEGCLIYSEHGEFLVPPGLLRSIQSSPDQLIY